MKPVFPSLWVLAPSLALSLALAGALQAQAQPQSGGQEARPTQSAPMYTPLRPVSSCLRTDRISEWHVVDSSTAIVRTGPLRYLVKLRAACPQITYGPPQLIFHSNKANQVAGSPWSICGEAGETVRGHDRPACPIQSVSQIDQGQFDQLSKQAVRHGSPASQPSKP